MCSPCSHNLPGSGYALGGGPEVAGPDAGVSISLTKLLGNTPCLPLSIPSHQPSSAW